VKTLQNGYFLEKEVGLDVVGCVLGSLDAAGLHDSDKVIIQSEDSAVLTSLKQRSRYKLAFRVVNPNESVGTPQILEIKELAAYVSLPKPLIQQESLGYLVNDSQLVHQFHAHNVSVFVSHIWNEFVHISFDHDSDPTLELHTFVQYFKIDGLITDFPATATAYLGKTLHMHKANFLYIYVCLCLWIYA
jgi:glycerophosphoryl diester phosphodiesterase